MNRIERRRESGFSLLETLVVSVIVGVLFAAAAPSLSTAVSAHQLQASLRSTAGYVRLVRATAIGKNLQSKLVVSTDGTTLTIQVYRSGSWATTGAPAVLSPGVTVLSVSPANLTFSTQGVASAATMITLQTARGYTGAVTVSLLGSVDISG